MAVRLLRLGPHEAENPTEVSLREAFELFRYQLKPPFPLTIPSPAEYLQLNRAILFGVLTEPHFGKIHFIHLNAIVTDGYEFFVSLLLKIVFESYPKLLEPVRVQLIWVASELVDVSAIGIDNLLISLLRQIVGGDFSDWNLWLSVELLKVLLGKWDWLLEEPLVLTSALFTYLRLLADHYRLSGSPKLEALKRMEIDFCVRVLRDQFPLCLRIGRDLIRLLQDLFHIPEFRAILKDLLLNPVKFRASGFSDISQLYCSRTSSRYLLLRITPDMETQLRFLLTYVRWGSQKRYQAWFARKFLCGPERESVISDIVRFICCAHHPSNEIIQSDVIPRWAIIGWLLKCCRKNHVEANVKLALFYDWLFFDERIDNIMNIEPGILLMVNSMPKYIDMTLTLLEFLFLLVDNYDIQRTDVIVRGVSAAFGILVRKGVVHSMDALISCNALPPLLKERLVKIFLSLKMGISKEEHPARLSHCCLPPLSLPSPSNAESQIPLSKELKVSTCARQNGFDNKAVDASVSVVDSPVASCDPVTTNGSRASIMENLIQNLGETIKRSDRMGLQALEEILFSFAHPGISTLDAEIVSHSVLNPEALACQITEAFKLNGYNMFSPVECPSNEPVCDDEIRSATALITRTFIFSNNERMGKMILFWSKNGCPVGARLLLYALRLASEAHLMGCIRNPMDKNNSAKVSGSEMSLLKYHIDCYVTFMTGGRRDSSDVITVDSKLVAKLVEGAFAAYRRFLVLSSNIICEQSDTSLVKLLFSDLVSCCMRETKRLKLLFCSIFFHLSDLSICEEDLIRLLLDRLDHADLITVQFEIGLKRFSIFGEDTDNISRLVKSSFNWGFVEQQKFWGLMRSELAVSNVQVDKVVRDFFCSGVIDPNVHSIAVGGLLMLCSCCAPTPELVGTMISLPNNTYQDFAATILASWAVSNASMLLTSLANCLEKINKKNGDSISFIFSGFRANDSAILELLNFLEKQGMKGINFLNRVSVDIPEIKAKLLEAAVVQDSR